MMQLAGAAWRRAAGVLAMLAALPILAAVPAARCFD
jgi:hypothetical protein